MIYYIVERRKELGGTENANCYLSGSMDKVRNWINDNKDFDVRDYFWWWAVLKIDVDDENGAVLFAYFDWDGNETPSIPENPIAAIFECFSDEKFIFNVCLSYRHDFGLLPKEEQDTLIFECKEWMRAIKNNYKS